MFLYPEGRNPTYDNMDPTKRSLSCSNRQHLLVFLQRYLTSRAEWVQKQNIVTLEEVQIWHMEPPKLFCASFGAQLKFGRCMSVFCSSNLVVGRLLQYWKNASHFRVVHPSWRISELWFRWNRTSCVDVDKGEKNTSIIKGICASRPKNYIKWKGDWKLGWDSVPKASQNNIIYSIFQISNLTKRKTKSSENTSVETWPCTKRTTIWRNFMLKHAERKFCIKRAVQSLIHTC